MAGAMVKTWPPGARKQYGYPGWRTSTTGHPSTSAKYLRSCSRRCERAKMCAKHLLQHSGTGERRNQIARRLPVGGRQVTARRGGSAASGQVRLAAAQDAGEQPVPGDDMADQVRDIPLGAGGKVRPPLPHPGHRCSGGIQSPGKPRHGFSVHHASLVLTGTTPYRCRVRPAWIPAQPPGEADVIRPLRGL